MSSNLTITAKTILLKSNYVLLSSRNCALPTHQCISIKEIIEATPIQIGIPERIPVSNR